LNFEGFRYKTAWAVFLTVLEYQEKEFVLKIKKTTPRRQYYIKIFTGLPVWLGFSPLTPTPLEKLIKN
jgi:hypothetical protein